MGSRQIQIENGYKVNKLIYVGEASSRIDTKQRKQRYIFVKCDCGSEIFEIRFPAFYYGYTKSCGCLNKESLRDISSTHKLSKHPLYSKYRDMLNRCYNPKVDRYDRYGGRGIRISEEWLGEEGFTNFYNWAIKNGYKDGLTIDRIDNNGNYCPKNCQWLTKRDNTIKRFVDNAKYIIIGESPTGEIYEFISRKDFSKLHELNSSGITGCLCGHSKTHKGWKFSKKEIIK